MNIISTAIVITQQVSLKIGKGEGEGAAESREATDDVSHQTDCSTQSPYLTATFKRIVDDMVLSQAWDEASRPRPVYPTNGRNQPAMVA